ncbi:hypothetical protein CRUP_029241 [Coryphaenoides rupestris]|nr:hypothetical protein CRUP_029241 [Coryphaenoides rupestris]
MPCYTVFGVLRAVLVVCGLALLGLLALATWKLCWVPWCSKALLSSPLQPPCALRPPLTPSPSPLPLSTPSPQQHQHQHHRQQHLLPLPAPPSQAAVAMATEKVKDPAAAAMGGGGSMGFLEAAVKISRTSPDIPTDVQLSMREHFLRRTQRMARQTTEPASSTSSFKRHSRQMQVGSLTWATTTRVDLTNGHQHRRITERKPARRGPTRRSATKSAGVNCGRSTSPEVRPRGDALLRDVSAQALEPCPPRTCAAAPHPYVQGVLLPGPQGFPTQRSHRRRSTPVHGAPVPGATPAGLPASCTLSVFDFDRFSRHDI